MSVAVETPDTFVKRPDAAVLKKYNLARRETDVAERAKLFGFGRMAKITTSFGDVYAQALRKGDHVRTSSGRFLPIISIVRRTFDEGILTENPDLQPVQVGRGAFDGRLPACDLVMAPDQTVRVRSMGTAGKLFSAKELIGRPGVTRKADTMVTYTTFSLGEPASVCCEGVWIDIPA